MRPLIIGGLELATPICLAPMAGFTDKPFRDLVRERGGLGLGFTEMIRPGGLIYGREKKTQWILATGPEDRPLGWQIYGREPELMAKAAQWLVERGAGLIDLNMGCPQKKIASRGAGAGLLKVPDLAVEIAEKVVKSVPVPVTVKIRLGWDLKTRIGLELARRLAGTGIAALTVHGRTASMGYSGEADWHAIAEIAAALPDLPVIGNGDISSAAIGAERLANSGCAGLMIGRSALRNPWLIRDLSRAVAGLPPLPPPEKAEVLALALDHFDRHAALYGTDKAAALFRKWIPLYIRALLKMQKPAMVQLLTIPGYAELRAALAALPV